MHGDYQKWLMKLMGFDFMIEYNLGKNNLVADALSRVTHNGIELGALLSSQGIDWHMLQEEVNKDVTLVRIREAVEKGEQVPIGFSIVNEVLFYKGRYVLAKSSFIPVLFERVPQFSFGRTCRGVEDIPTVGG